MVTWPGMLNGRIDRSLMRNVVNAKDRAEVDGDFMQPAAAYNFKRMQRDCFAETGVWIETEEAYRSYGTQVWYAGPNSPLPAGTAVAPPGASRHGWGLANDLKNYEAAWGWLQANAWKYGFSWAEGKASNERWHWVYVGSLSTDGINFDEFWGVQRQEEERRILAMVIYRNYETNKIWRVFGRDWIEVPPQIDQQLAIDTWFAATGQKGLIQITTAQETLLRQS